jgi:hypothetical protein
MAVSYNTSLVRNGLVLYLDAANKKSYSGTGTSWIDLSGNSNNATLENGAGYNANNNGTMSFDAIDDYANITNSSIGNFGTSNFSVNCWFKASSGSSGTRGVFSKYDPHSGPGTGWFIFAIDGTIWVRITQDLVDPKEYSEISIELLDKVLQMPFEFVISQSFDFSYRESELEFAKHQDKMFKL